MANSRESEAEDSRSAHWDSEIEGARRRRETGEYREELERAREQILRIDKELEQALEVDPGNIPRVVAAPPPEKVVLWLAELRNATTVTLGVDEEAHAKALELWGEIQKHFRA